MCLIPALAATAPGQSFVGSAACKSCHPFRPFETRPARAFH
jgi:hypothetical protein